jgi:hypothetical protein
MIHLWHKWGKVKQWGGIPQRKCLICGKLEQDVTAADGCGGMIKFLEEEDTMGKGKGKPKGPKGC